MNNNLRNFEKNTKQYQLYKKMYINQDLNFVKKKLAQYSNFKKKWTMSQVFEMLDTFIDVSDPDVNMPNSFHAIQTAERCRREQPSNFDLQITCLIHDFGKILFKFKEQQFCIVGDTYIVGYPFPKSIVFYNLLKNNKNFKKYTKTKNIYKSKCGLDNVLISFGHDEYLYRVLKFNKENHKLSNKYLNIIRFHSLYPWHSGNAYKELMTEKDKDTLKNVLEFNNYDLYSKSDELIITHEIKEYYNNLLKLYFPKPLFW